MKKIFILVVLIITSVIAGTFGKELVKELIFKNEANNAIKECVELGQSEEVCKKVIQEVVPGLENAQDQTGEARENAIEDAGKKAFIASCSQQKTTKYRECGYQKIMNKYGREGWGAIKSKLGRIGPEGMKSDPELKAFSSYITIEIPKVCPQ
jgi:hypothetical protein